MRATLRAYRKGNYHYADRIVDLGKFSDHASMASSVMNHLFDRGIAGKDVFVDTGNDVYSITFYRGDMILESLYTGSQIVLSRGSGYVLWF